jgi:hypothetical protein
MVISKTRGTRKKDDWTTWWTGCFDAFYFKMVKSEAFTVKPGDLFWTSYWGYVCKTPWKAMAFAGLTSEILVDHSPSETDSFWHFEKASEPPHCLTGADGFAQGWGSRSIWHYGSCWQWPSALQWVSLKGYLGERSWLCWDIRRSHEHVKTHRLHVPVSTAHFSIFIMFPRYYSCQVNHEMFTIV